jgi:hypothetical protein
MICKDAVLIALPRQLSVNGRYVSINFGFRNREPGVGNAK